MYILCHNPLRGIDLGCENQIHVIIHQEFFWAQNSSLLKSKRCTQEASIIPEGEQRHNEQQ